eukprot:362717-Chlamydomonas_euryale.AAC.1
MHEPAHARATEREAVHVTCQGVVGRLRGVERVPLVVLAEGAAETGTPALPLRSPESFTASSGTRRPLPPPCSPLPGGPAALSECCSLFTHSTPHTPGDGGAAACHFQQCADRRVPQFEPAWHGAGGWHQPPLGGALRVYRIPDARDGDCGAAAAQPGVDAWLGSAMTRGNVVEDAGYVVARSEGRRGKNRSLHSL